MKKILTLFILSSITSLAFSQERIGLSKSIDDNGTDISIRVNGVVHGKPIDFARTFSVQGLDKIERNALADRILDSLGVGKIESPTAPLTPVLLSQPELDLAPPLVTASGSSHYGSAFSQNESVKQSFPTIPNQPYTKEVRYDDESGLLYLRYHFFRSRDEYIFEKTAHAADKSESERQEIIRDFEKEIELPATI
jgi:hypothetical protein